MLHTLAIANYRSLRNLVLPLGSLNVVTGPNGSGKSNLYRGLRLLSETAFGRAIESLAGEGGFESVLWAGPETLSRGVKRGDCPVQGGPRKGPAGLRFGFCGEDFSYAIDFGLPTPSRTMFNRDPEIKREVIWRGEMWHDRRPARPDRPQEWRRACARRGGRLAGARTASPPYLTACFRGWRIRCAPRKS